ncbi:MAG: transporter, partial [Pseudomonadota bacterium]
VSPILPDADRYEFTIGAGYEISGVTIDAAYLFLFTGDNNTSNQAPITGTYRSHSHVASLSLAYKLDI